MTVKIDKLGRILIPKSVREAHGLLPGDELELATPPDEARGIHLLPKRVFQAVIREGGPLPVVDFLDGEGNSAPRDPAWVTAAETAREERVDRLIDALA